MQLNNRFHEVFGRIPILGMIHLAGEKPVQRALEEIAIFEEEGVDGAIIENYHGNIRDIFETLRALENKGQGLVLGVNILPNEYGLAFQLAETYNADFVQLDHVAGIYRSGLFGTTLLDSRIYNQIKSRHPNIITLGGVHPKYYTPISESDLETDLRQGMGRAEAIVVTGEATGRATPLEKVKLFRRIMGEHPLIIGAGLTPDNAYDSLVISDGAIVGSWFKPNADTRAPIDRVMVRDFMAVVQAARAYQARL